jgi:serine/threonine protein kinase
MEQKRANHEWTEDSATLIFKGILKGIEVMHMKRVIHRDLKPENILMKGDSPKIADLGLAKEILPVK